MERGNQSPGANGRRVDEGSAGQARLLRASPSANPVGIRARHEKAEQPTGTKTPIHRARFGGGADSGCGSHGGERRARAEPSGDPAEAQRLEGAARSKAVPASAHEGSGRGSLVDDPEVRGSAGSAPR